MNRITLLVCLLCVALSRAEYQELPNPSNYEDPNSIWIYAGPGLELNKTSILYSCETYGKTNIPSVCPSDRELYQTYCVRKCTQGYKRIAPCACQDPVTEKVFDDCTQYGDVKHFGMDQGPTCAENEELHGQYCFSGKCPETHKRYEACACGIFRNVKGNNK